MYLGWQTFSKQVKINLKVLDSQDILANLDPTTQSHRMAKEQIQLYLTLLWEHSQQIPLEVKTVK